MTISPFLSDVIIPPFPRSIPNDQTFYEMINAKYKLPPWKNTMTGS
jgi:hypothetical protein